MDCRIVQNSLSNYLDGLLPGEEVKLIESHLGDCSRCSVVRLDLHEIRIAARELPLHTPSRALWARLQQSIDLETAVDEPGAHKTVRQPGSLARWWSELMSQRFTFSFPQLAGAGALSMLLVGVSLFGVWRQGTGVSPAPDLTQAQAALIPEEPALRKRIETLTSSLASARAGWDTTTLRLYESKLARIHQSLEECRQQLREKPGDKEHEQMMRDLYREEIELLELFSKIK